MLRRQWCWLRSGITVVVLTFVYTILRTKVNAYRTAALWRKPVFLKPFRRALTVNVSGSGDGSAAQMRFLSTRWARQEALSTDFSRTYVQLDEVFNCLLRPDSGVLTIHKPLVEEFYLFASHCHTLVKSHDHHSYNLRHNNNNNNKNTSNNKICASSRSSYQFIESALESLQGIVVNSRSLRCLTLGYVQDLTDRADVLLPLLARHQPNSLTTLGLASIKYDPNSYALLDITPDHFTAFRSLQVLSLDYDYMSDRLLSILSTPYNTPLRRLILNVHGIDQTHRGTTDYCWHRLKHQHPQCNLYLNLIHSYDGVELLSSGLLHPSMPLTNFRAFFCEWINIPSLRLLATWYSDSLRELMLVDSLDHSGWGMLTEGRDNADHQSPDPLVMLAWRCKNLKNLTVCGYGYNGSDVVAIARLRGSALSTLIIPEDCLEVDDSHELANQEDIDNIAEDVSGGLARTWRPVTLSEMHPCLRTTSSADTDHYMLPILHQDLILTTC
ncbi:unnamed protein product, partial [Meganyctiphanes norvegica]